MSSLRNTDAKNLAHADSILRNLVVLLLPLLHRLFLRHTAVAAHPFLDEQQLALSCVA